MAATRDKQAFSTIALLIAICVLAFPVEAKYGGGTGEPNDPYLIYTPGQLNAVGASPNDWDKHFKLMADIDLSEYSDGEFNIIGRLSSGPKKPFVGLFDGNGHTISNFTWRSDGENSIGFFGCVGRPDGFFGYGGDHEPEIRNLGLLSPRIDARSGCYVGALVGFLCRARVVACYVQDADVAGSGDVGGLVGLASGVLSTSYSTGSVLGETSVGGLTGYNEDCILSCYSHASVRCEQYGGGLVGSTFYESTIVNCYAVGAVSGHDHVGGLTGDGAGSTVNCCWDTETSGQREHAGESGKTTVQMQIASTFTGWTRSDGEQIWTIDEGRDYPRLRWENKPGHDLTSIRLRDLLTGLGTRDCPFLIRTPDELNWIGRFPYEWDKHFTLEADLDLSHDVEAAFNVIGMHGLPFSGTLDGNNHTIANFQYAIVDGSYCGLFGCICDPNAEVRDLTLLAPSLACDGGRWVGGLAGELKYGRIINCTVREGVVSGMGLVGGLVGYNREGVVTNCHVAAVVTGDAAGGLIGLNEGDLRNCSSAGVVTGDHRAGGLVASTSRATITNCGSTSDVSGQYEVGGLAGFNCSRGTLANCYAAGRVTGDQYTGGLLGHNGYLGTVANCYAVGPVAGSKQVGGLIGGDDANQTIVQASYWDVETTGQAVSAGGVGLETTAMKTARTFLDAGWDFVGETANGVDDIWWILDGQDYPRLSWEAP